LRTERPPPGDSNEWSWGSPRVGAAYRGAGREEEIRREARRRKGCRARRDTPEIGETDFSETYFSIVTLTPEAATLTLAPFVSLFRLMTTPLPFFRDETPAPLPAVPSAPAAA